MIFNGVTKISTRQGKMNTYRVRYSNNISFKYFGIIKKVINILKKYIVYHVDDFNTKKVVKRPW